jgi:hypothetical protein
MLTYQQINTLARANMRVDATRAALIAQAACAEHIASRPYLLELLDKRTKELVHTYAQVTGEVFLPTKAT